MFKRVLIANRGEIAVRAIRTCRELGISPIAVYSAADRASLHVRMADRAFAIGPAPARESYLAIERMIEAARQSGAEAIFPGYGFLSENPRFAEACAAAGLVFVGPSAAVMRTMGDKRQARLAMQRAGVPVVPGVHGDAEGLADAAAAMAAAQSLGVPVMLKAAAGGGGKGMRLVRDLAALPAAFDAARGEALAAFGDGTMYLEKVIEQPRHVEIQVLADTFGETVHFFERDCSLQRRQQKVIEETHCPVLDEATRQAMGQVAVQAARAVGYVSAGTVELLFDERQRSFYFLEMNTRLQVEHPITELCCGVDLLREQLRIAAGLRLEHDQAAIQPRGAAIECRVYAEDPQTFLPSPGKITALQVPAGLGIRDDSGVYLGAEISTHYDPLLSKLCAWAPTRAEAIARMQRALAEYRVAGIRTNLPFLQRMVGHPAFLQGAYDTGFIDAHRQELCVPAAHAPSAAQLAAVLVQAQQQDVASSSVSSATVRSPSLSAWRERFAPRR